MNVYTDQIKAALVQLDTTDDSQWTDDGSPATKAVQKLTGELGIKRSDINEIAPGFSRTNPVFVDAPAAAAQPQEPQPQEPGSGGGGAKADARKAALDAEVDQAKKRVTAANDAFTAARSEIAAANKAHDAAVTKRQREYPPLTQAENIQQFIRNEALQRAAKAGASHVYAAPSQLDAAMSNRGNARGWGRPNRGLLEPTAPQPQE